MKHTFLIIVLIIIALVASGGIGWTLREITWIMVSEKDAEQEVKHIDTRA